MSDYSGQTAKKGDVSRGGKGYVHLNDSPPAEHFGMAPAFLFVKIDRLPRKIFSTQKVKNPHHLAERKRRILTAEFLNKKGLDILAIKDLTSFGLGPKAILSENYVELHQFKGNSIQEILS